MADAKVTALSALTAVTGDDLLYVVDDPAGTPASKKATAAVFRDFTNMAHAALADADTTMAVNTLYVGSMAAWATADRTYTLPTTAAVGDRIGIMITGGNATYELIITAGTSDTLNGVAGGTEWSRLFITNEVVIMRCVTADSAWIVEQDGRIASAGAVQGSWTNTTSGSWVVSDLNGLTVDANVGSVVDTANDRIVIRRAGKYVYTVTASNTHNTANKLTGTYVRKNGSTAASGTNFAQSATAGSVGTGSGYGAVLAAGDYLEQMYYQNDTTSESCSIGFAVTEVF